MPGMPEPAAAPALDEVPLDRTIVTGYDVEALVDAAMGLREMPSAPQFYDAMGQPLTRIVAAAVVPIPSRILMLRNMVTDDDVATQEAMDDLKQEVGEECSKFGTLLAIELSQRLIYLEYDNLRHLLCYSPLCRSTTTNLSNFTGPSKVLELFLTTFVTINIYSKADPILLYSSVAFSFDVDGGKVLACS